MRILTNVHMKYDIALIGIYLTGMLACEMPLVAAILAFIWGYRMKGEYEWQNNSYVVE